MKLTNDDHRLAVAVFRYGVIAPLLRLKPRSAEMSEEMRRLASMEWDIPGTERVRIAEQTIRDWLRAHNRGGFEALKPKPRVDSGKPRRMSEETIDTLIATKRDNPELSVRAVIKAVCEADKFAVLGRLAPTTVHRLFREEGLMDLPRSPALDHRRFTCRWRNELWHSDVMHGPNVRDANGRARKAYLIAFLDDATRVIPYAAFTMAENVSSYMPVFQQALTRRGRPSKLYVDNGSNFRSKHLSVVCARLDIALIHTRPYKPQGRGKIERWFRTVRMQFLPLLQKPEDLRSLEVLNSKLWAWIEGEYHRTPHRSLDGLTPLDRWANCSADMRMVSHDLDLNDMFLFEAKRKVNKDRTVSLHTRLYEVDAALVGETVVLRYDPEAPPARPIQVVLDGKVVCEATLLDPHANSNSRRQPPQSPINFRDPDEDPGKPSGPPKPSNKGKPTNRKDK